MDDVFAGESVDIPFMTATEAFVQQLTTQVNHRDVHKMAAAQAHMLQRFEKTNEMLLNFNALSKSRYNTTQQDFKQHTVLLADMKKDLDTIFKRIRVLKNKLSRMYPEAFKACSDVYNLMEEPEEEEESDNAASTAVTPVTPKVLSHQGQNVGDFPTPAHANILLDPVEPDESEDNDGLGTDSYSQNYDRHSTSTIVEEDDLSNQEKLVTDS